MSTMPRVLILDSRHSGTPDSREVDLIGHGTACLSLVGAACPGATLECRAVVDDAWEGVIGALADAIRVVAKDYAVINISLGTTAPQAADSPLARVCQDAADAGTIIVAAAHNDDLVCFPAHFPSVIGVRGGPLRGEETYYYCPGQPIECIARGDAQRLQWKEGGQVLTAGNSFAAPRITGIVARLKADHPEAGLDEIRERLRAGAARVIEADRPPTRVTVGASLPTSHPRRVALFPYTKEMHALVRFRDLLDFEIAGIADPPGRAQAGLDAGESIGADPANIRIEPRLQDVLDGVDTLVLGYIQQLGRLQGRDLQRECLERAVDAGLHVFSFEPPQDCDDVLRGASERGLSIRWPGIDRASARAILAGPDSDPPVAAPVLGIFGTSSSQGKFTLQLALRRHVQREGYRLVQVGTEHHAGLFGMDAVFPMGYAPAVDAPLEALPRLVDRVVRRCCAEKRPDLVIAGSQSGTVPFDLLDPRTMTLSTLAFLMGIKPDACLLVVNAIDPEDYIEDTIAGLRSVGQCDVVGLAVSDRTKEVREAHGRHWAAQRRAGAAELAETTARLEARFAVPAACIASASGIGRLWEAAVAAFTTEEEEAWRRKRA
jgi:uncharacterized NAD-dependent epimerase/dehydratase family protein